MLSGHQRKPRSERDPDGFNFKCGVFNRFEDYISKNIVMALPSVLNPKSGKRAEDGT